MKQSLPLQVQHSIQMRIQAQYRDQVRIRLLQSQIQPIVQETSFRLQEEVGMEDIYTRGMEVKEGCQNMMK